MFDIDWKGLILPSAYILVLGGFFVMFSTIYRKRKACAPWTCPPPPYPPFEAKLTSPPGTDKSANLEPWFPPHLQRNIYLSLLHIEPEEGDEKTPKVPDGILRAALLRRATEDIHRIIQIRTAKQACGSLLQRGSVGDELWQRFSRAEKEMEEELRDVVMEVRPPLPPYCCL